MSVCADFSELLVVVTSIQERKKPGMKKKSNTDTTSSRSNTDPYLGSHQEHKNTCASYRIIVDDFPPFPGRPPSPHALGTLLHGQAPRPWHQQAHHYSQEHEGEEHGRTLVVVMVVVRRRRRVVRRRKKCQARVVVMMQGAALVARAGCAPTSPGAVHGAHRTPATTAPAHARLSSPVHGARAWLLKAKGGWGDTQDSRRREERGSCE